MRLFSPIRPRRTGALSAWFLLALPIGLLLGLIAINRLLLSDLRGIQETVTDASALASAQTLVDDHHLVGDLDPLEAMARLAAQQYADFNPIEGQKLQYVTPSFPEFDDILFERVPHPLDPLNTQIVRSVRVHGRNLRIRDAGVKLFGYPLFPLSRVDLVTTSAGLLDRAVVGMRPLYARNIPLAPIALDEMTWNTMIEANLIGSPYNALPNAAYAVGVLQAVPLNIGTSGLNDVATQIGNGVTPADLQNPPFNDEFIVPPATSKAVPAYLVATDYAPLVPPLQALAASGEARVWPVFFGFDGMTAQPLVKRFVAARVVSATPVTDPMTMQTTAIALVLRPTAFASPMVVTDTAQTEVNLYVCRVRLTP
jgi:hypothetical protein